MNLECLSCFNPYHNPNLTDDGKNKSEAKLANEPQHFNDMKKFNNVSKATLENMINEEAEK